MIDCTCKTCPQFKPDGWMEEHGTCDVILCAHTASFGCIAHPNWAKVLERAEQPEIRAMSAQQIMSESGTTNMLRGRTIRLNVHQ